jgi:hypothetical protein
MEDTARIWKHNIRIVTPPRNSLEKPSIMMQKNNGCYYTLRQAFCSTSHELIHTVIRFFRDEKRDHADFWISYRGLLGSDVGPDWIREHVVHVPPLSFRGMESITDKEKALMPLYTSKFTRSK